MNSHRLKSRLAVLVVLLAGSWLTASAQNGPAASQAMPSQSIPTFSSDNIARMAYFYAGGQYVGEPGKEVMAGAMYTEVWVPKQIRSPYPIVFFAGAGQTAVDLGTQPRPVFPTRFPRNRRRLCRLRCAMNSPHEAGTRSGHVQ